MDPACVFNTDFIRGRHFDNVKPRFEINWR